MSTTTTGNIKISQLSQLSTIDNGDKLRIPVSRDKSTTSTPDWESYSVSASVLSSFLEDSLGLNDSGDTQGLRSDVSYLMQESIKYNELEKKLGKYDLVSQITFSVGEQVKYISTSGTKESYSSYFISNEITLKQGNLYLLQANYADYNSDALPADLAIMAKVDKNEYRVPDGTTATDIVYEPLPNHYRTSNKGGYGVPASHYFVFFATENMNVVISGASGTISNTLYEVKYGAFIEAASKLLTINGDLMKVIVEAIVKNKKDIDSINENMKSLGDIHANSIDLDDFPSVQGEPMVVVADRQPSVAANNHGDDVPNRIGQIWVDTANKRAYIAVALGSTGDASWKPITV